MRKKSGLQFGMRNCGQREELKDSLLMYEALIRRNPSNAVIEFKPGWFKEQPTKSSLPRKTAAKSQSASQPRALKAPVRNAISSRTLRYAARVQARDGEITPLRGVDIKSVTSVAAPRPRASPKPQREDTRVQARDAEIAALKQAVEEARTENVTLKKAGDDNKTLSKLVDVLKERKEVMQGEIKTLEWKVVRGGGAHEKGNLEGRLGGLETKERELILKLGVPVMGEERALVRYEGGGGD